MLRWQYILSFAVLALTAVVLGVKDGLVTAEVFVGGLLIGVSIGLAIAVGDLRKARRETEAREDLEAEAAREGLYGPPPPKDPGMTTL
jgi:hypothetical protein